MLKKWSIPALLACMTLQSLSARNIFVTSADLASSAVSTFSVEPLSFAGTFNGPAGASQVLAGPGAKYYIIARQATEGIAVAQGNFPNLQISKRLLTPGVPVGAAISPDGRRLVVVGAGITILDTATDNPVPTTVNVGTNPISVAISADSRRAFVLNSDARRLYVINLDNGGSAGELTIAGNSTAVSVGPNTLVYVSAQNAVYEIDPQALTQTNTFALNGLPGAIAFSQDGRTGITPNAESVASITQKSGFLLDLVRRRVSDIPYTGFALDKIVVGDANNAYAFSSRTGRVYLINLVNLTAPTIFNVSGATLEGVRDIAISNEVPSAKKLFALTNNNLYTVDLGTNVVNGPVSVPFAGNLSYAGPPSSNPISTLYQLNNTQTVAPGATSLPIIVQALDNQGVPIAGVTVTFATTASVNLSSPTATTDLRGYAQTYITVPASTATGAVTVTATASGQSVTFNINVGTGGGTNPGGGGTAPTGGLQILKGQGQVTSVGFPTPTAMTVIVKDAAGNPVPNVPITWSIIQGNGSLLSPTDKTDEKGQATASFINPLVGLGEPFSQTVIAATTGTETVNFYVSTIANLPNGTPGNAAIRVIKPLDLLIISRSGETLTEAIQAQVAALLGGVIPNVGLRIVTPDGAPTATCKGGIPLSDAQGIVTCDLIGGSILGETPAQFIIGEQTAFPFTLRVVAGSPAVVKIVSGNNQIGTAGSLLPQALVVDITDAGGNLLPGAPVTFELVTPGTATLSQTSSATDSKGRASTRVTLGQQPGLVQIRARSGTGSATFSLTSNLNAASITKLPGGDNQTAVIGQPFAQPLSVRVLDPQQRPVPGASVAFTLVSGTATVPGSATTDATGVASATVTAGQTAGPVVIRASIGSVSETFNLTVRTPGPVFTATSIVNAAGFQPGISPGGLAYITVSGIAPTLRGSLTPGILVGALPTSLGGVEVLFNNVLSPIYAVSNINGVESVIVQVPFEVTPGQASVTIRTAGGGSTTVQGVQIRTVQPGIFQYQDPNGRTYAVALRSDGSYISSSNPGRRGEIIRVYVAGLGQTTPAAATNRAGVKDQNVVGTIISGINDGGVRTVSAKMAEGAIGIYTVEMEIPIDTATGPARNLAVGVLGSDGQPIYGGAQIPIQ